MTGHPFDLQAQIAQLFVYPIKSCAGISLRASPLFDTGLEFDREFMVVDAAGEFVSQRQLPSMALIRPTLKHSEMILRAPGMLALHVSLERVEAAVRVKVWKDEVAAFDMGDLAAQWFSDFLSEPVRPQRIRLVRFHPAQRRLASPKWTGGVEAPVAFADGFPLLITSEASLAALNQRLAAQGRSAVGIERFRPNIVLAGIEAHDEDRIDLLHIATSDGEAQLQPVKPCARCPIPDVDPLTAEQGTSVGNALRAYRADPRVDGAITFGMNAIVRQGDGHLLQVGQTAGANLRFA